MKKVLVVLLLGSVGMTYAQERTKCGERFFMTSKMRPVYGNSSAEIGKYLLDKVKIDTKKRVRGIFLVNINCSGEIFHNEMIRGNMTKDMQRLIYSALVEMPQWTPADYDGPVDYQFYLDILYLEDGSLKVNPIMR